MRTQGENICAYACRMLTRIPGDWLSAFCDSSFAVLEDNWDRCPVMVNSEGPPRLGEEITAGNILPSGQQSEDVPTW